MIKLLLILVAIILNCDGFKYVSASSCPDITPTQTPSHCTTFSRSTLNGYGTYQCNTCSGFVCPSPPCPIPVSDSGRVCPEVTEEPYSCDDIRNLCEHGGEDLGYLTLGEFSSDDGGSYACFACKDGIIHLHSEESTSEISDNGVVPENIFLFVGVAIGTALAAIVLSLLVIRFYSRNYNHRFIEVFKKVLLEETRKDKNRDETEDDLENFMTYLRNNHSLLAVCHHGACSHAGYILFVSLFTGLALAILFKTVEFQQSVSEFRSMTCSQTSSSVSSSASQIRGFDPSDLSSSENLSTSISISFISELLIKQPPALLIGALYLYNLEALGYLFSILTVIGLLGWAFFLQSQVDESIGTQEKAIFYSGIFLISEIFSAIFTDPFIQFGMYILKRLRKTSKTILGIQGTDSTENAKQYHVPSNHSAIDQPKSYSDVTLYPENEHPYKPEHHTSEAKT